MFFFLSWEEEKHVYDSECVHPVDQSIQDHICMQIHSGFSALSGDMWEHFHLVPRPVLRNDFIHTTHCKLAVLGLLL